MEFQCLFCLGQYIEEAHYCSEGGLCQSDKHLDFCLMCMDLVLENFKKQFTEEKRLPNNPRFRLEGER